MTRLLGAILAGGRSQRFGSDKAVALLAGQSLIDRVVAALAPQVDSMVLVGRAGDIAAIPDRPLPDLGPLGGLNAALHHARAQGYPAVMTVGCDMPVLPPDLAERLRASGCPSYVEAIPIIGLWPADLADQLDIFLASDRRRSMRGWATEVGAAVLSLAEDLPNINTPDDLSLLARTFPRD
ncbi:molybdenum cofactor guanylyltransferase [Sphingomonas alpina]|uniref:Molybdenum cofactor guanylyltransferase n=1 Tax=Sphingomonas alpina TaxID=653931 RepID=A0A7H0LFZ1_9SPHN|nr:molybdenum cofactor guanylyltransferase [Sphingomonas alpina]QNQ08594.1 molybdenum cofactor guanylyltransferase [Sphingomonas alpina]